MPIECSRPASTRHASKLMLEQYILEGTTLQNENTAEVEEQPVVSQRCRDVENGEAFAASLHPEDLSCAVSRFEQSLKNLERNLSAGRGSTEGPPIDDFASDAQNDFERFFNLIPDLACIVSTDGYFKRVNPAWETSLGFTLEEVLKTPMLDFIHPDDLERTLNEVAKQSPQHRTKNFVNRYRCKDGSYRILDWTTTFNRDESTRFGVARDITDQRRAESAAQAMVLQIAHAAEHDFLTGLPNRTLLNDRLTRAIDLAQRESKKVSLVSSTLTIPRAILLATSFFNPSQNVWWLACTGRAR
jgi:PAS domain S-box-containing protein